MALGPKYVKIRTPKEEIKYYENHVDEKLKNGSSVYGLSLPAIINIGYCSKEVIDSLQTMYIDKGWTVGTIAIVNVDTNRASYKLVFNLPNKEEGIVIED